MDPARWGPYSYVLTEEERANFRRRARRRWRASGATMGWRPTVIALALILGASLWLALSGAVSPHASQVALMFGVASYFTGKWLHHWEIERAYAQTEAKAQKTEPADDGQRTVAIDETFVAAETRAVKAQYGWENFIEIEEASGLIHLWMSRLQALVIPARAFGDAGRRDAFLAFARARIKPS